jgi:Ni,Fe-hydrogenase III small subunit
MWNLLKRSLRMGRLTESRLDQAAPHLRSLQQSWHIRHLDCGSCNGCDWEMTALLNPVYDIQRFGFDFVASPRHADILMCTGPLAEQLRQAATDTYEATPHPKLVVAVGDCAVNGGVFSKAYAAQAGIGETLPVHLEIPGCPPSPDDILKALLKLTEQDRIKGEDKDTGKDNDNENDTDNDKNEDKNKDKDSKDADTNNNNNYDEKLLGAADHVNKSS